MIQSMTGYGKSIVQLPAKKITVELKSLNSKNLDINARVPGAYREKELILRNRISKSLVRGKVDFNLFVEITGEATNTEVNETVVKQYIKQLKKVVDGDETELLKMAVRMPDALKTERDEIDEEEFNKILEALDTALAATKDYRKDEGRSLEAEFKLRINNILQLLKEVEAIDPQRIELLREKLRKAVSELKESVDENRFEQELIYYLEKYDITEEKVRLKKHLEYFQETLAQPISNGKKLGFISQEIGREINTIGSKANFAPMQQVVVQMKDELEKIKEQALNVL
ncbi:MAG: YicC family protein [Bacteroidia bacterium]|nr:YicC family protein [Bacteroidia bacterium]NNM23850.1 YicC family protein [Flavobacteriaceae bacterium]